MPKGSGQWMMGSWVLPWLEPCPKGTSYVLPNGTHGFQFASRHSGEELMALAHPCSFSRWKFILSPIISISRPDRNKTSPLWKRSAVGSWCVTLASSLHYLDQAFPAGWATISYHTECITRTSKYCRDELLKPKARLVKVQTARLADSQRYKCIQGTLAWLVTGCKTCQLCQPCPFRLVLERQVHNLVHGHPTVPEK